MRVLLSAYACEPGKGSEPGIGWNVAGELAKWHEVWVLTRENNRPAIEAETARNPIPGLHFCYHDLPCWARKWKRGPRGVQLYYYLWQLSAFFVARRVNHGVRFDLAHHVTFGKYWTPSFLGFLKVPFLWGPVGGGDTAPLSFWRTFGLCGVAYETLRSLARWLGEHDPLVRLTARRAALALATTQDTASRLKGLGASRVEVISQASLPQGEVRWLAALPRPPSDPIRVLSLGRLLHWKGFHLGLAAFARSLAATGEYWIVGEGPERKRLERLAHTLGMAHRVRFLGALPREEAMLRLGECHLLLHPSLHDSGGWACLEAMAAGRPVICLDLGGPALQVTEETGVKVGANTPQQVVRELAGAMVRLANDPGLSQRMGEAGMARVRDMFSSEGNAVRIDAFYRDLLNALDSDAGSRTS